MKKLRLLITVVILLLLHTALFAQNFWEKANGPYSGNIYTIAIDKTSGIMYCGTWDGGIFRSRDNGEHWEEANNGILNSYIYSIIVNNDGTVFAGTPSSIFKSTDFGNSWQNCFYQFPGWIISFAKNSRGEIFAGTNYGKVHLSTNNGINWSEIYNDGYNWIYSIAIDSSDNIFLATSYYGVLVSENNGISWKEKNNGFFIPVIQSININHENGKIFVGANDGIYSSTNSGDEWIRIDSTLSSVKLIRFLSDGGLIANDFFSLWLSEDEGLIWSSITENTEVETQAIKTFVITSKNEIYAGNSGDGIYFSSDKGSTWSFRANGITNVQFKSMLIDHLDNIYIGTYYAGISKSTNGGISFNRINSGIGYPFILSLGCNLNNDLFAGSFGEGVYRSTDGGVSWQTFNSGLENLGIHSIQVKKTGVIFLGTEGGIYRSTNNGYSWHKRGFNNSKIECLAIDSSDNLLLGVYDYSNPFEPKAYLYRSSNEGLNWETIKEFFRINSIHIGTYGNYYVSAGNSFYYSYDQGVNWGQSAIPHSIYAITSNKNNLLYVGTINGVYVSTDLGVSWGELHSGLPSTVINVPCLEIDSKGYIYIGITDQTMYKSKSSTTDIDDQHYVINNFKLSQNYPNPFNPSTKISWQSPIGSWQTLKVYDVLGNEVATLVNEYRPAGNYEVEFSAKGGSAIGGNVAQESLPAIASGVYFYRLQAGSYVQTKKMIYLK